MTGYTARNLIYTLSDAHIYEGQMKDVDDMLATEPRPFPTVEIDPTVRNLLDFRQEHFRISDYYPQLSRRKIWTPI